MSDTVLRYILSSAAIGCALALDIAFIHLRRSTIRLITRWRATPLARAAIICGYLIIPALALSTILIGLFPALMLGKLPLTLSALKSLSAAILQIAFIAMLLCSPALLIGRLRDYLLRCPEYLDSLLGVVIFRIIVMLYIIHDSPFWAVTTDQSLIRPSTGLTLVGIMFIFSAYAGIRQMLQHIMRKRLFATATYSSIRSISAIIAMGASIMLQCLPVGIHARLSRQALCRINNEQSIVEDDVKTGQNLSIYQALTLYHVLDTMPVRRLMQQYGTTALPQQRMHESSPLP